jgi:sulfur carrier protein
MTITLNGSSHPIAPETTVADLLESLGLNDKPVVVELDGQVVFPREHHEKLLVDGARIEIVMLAAGG